MLTTTLRHTKADPLKPLWPVVSAGLGHCLSGRKWVELSERLGYVGSIRTVEVTHGDDAGWHPHIHALLLWKRPLTVEETAEVKEFVWTQWKRHAETKTGRSVLPELMKLEEVRCLKAIGPYLNKIVDGSGGLVGLEMTRQDLKEGRCDNKSPWQLLEAAVQGDESAAVLWREYEQATKGKRCVVWSKGLKELLGVGEELSDEQIAGEGDGGADEGVELVPVSREEYRAVVRVGATARVLDVAENEGADAVRRLLALLLAGQPGELCPAPVWSDRGQVWRPN